MNFAKTILITSIFLLIGAYASSQNIYKGKSLYRTDIIANVSGSFLYKGASKYQTDILYSFDGYRIRKGSSKYESDVVAIYEAKKLYNKKTSRLIGKFSNGTFYRGSTYSNALFSYDGKYVRYKDSKYDSDILLTTDAYVNPIFLYLVLFEY